MNNTESTETCAHTPCKCARPSDDEYCSLHCRNAAGGTEKNCSCGHPDCLWPGPNKCSRNTIGKIRSR